MHQRETALMQVLSSCLALFCVIVMVAPLAAGYLKPPLDKVLDESKPDSKIKVIAVLADQIDNEALNLRLKNAKATFAQRHYEVISSLQQKAALTQRPLIKMLNDLEKEGKVEAIRNFWIANAIAFSGTPEAIRQIAALDYIENVEYDLPIELIKPIKGEFAPPIISTHSQGLDVIHAPQVWAMGYTGAGRLVSNIDTGVDGTHPALSSRWRGNNGHPASQCWYDPVGNTSYPEDYGEHGTHTMGTICGRSSTTYDTVGVAINAQWIACATIDNGATTQQMIASFQFVADPDDNPYTTDDVPDVVSNSWGWSPFWPGYSHCDNTFWSAMDGAENAGVVVVFAAGNEGENGANSLRTPADRASSYYNAFSVGAIDGHTAGYPIAYFSSLGPCQCASGNMNIKPELVAPGVNVRSSVPGGGYQETDWSGTSMATPHIAGSVAILRQVNPNLDVDQIKEIMLQSCVDLGTAGEDNTYGHGYLDLYQAVQLAMTERGYINGYVRDNVYSQPIPALVSIIGSSVQTTANSSGYYFLSAAPPETTYTVRATYNGYVQDQASIYVIQDDTVAHNFYLGPPIIDAEPVSYNVVVQPGNTTDRDLSIINSGVGTIYYNLNTETYTTLALDDGQEIPAKISAPQPEPLGYKEPDQGKPGAGREPYYPPMILDQGGPDAFGHTWIDSDEPGGPAVTWVDISSQGTAITFTDDDEYVSVPVGFSFPFFTGNYSTIYVSTNGILTFGTGTTDYTNDGIPNSATPNNFIAPWWDDLSPQWGGSVRYYYDSANSRFIVSYIGVPNYTWSGGTGSLSFQAILYASGRIDFNYQTMNPGTDDLVSATIGIENSSGNDGLQIAYSQSYMHSNLSLRISASYWLDVAPTSGMVPPHDTSIATVTFDASDLALGIYTGNINLTNNSPNDPDIDIPVTLNVSNVPTPAIVLNASAIWDTVYSGYSTVFNLQISNTGDAVLNYGVSDNRTWISENPTGGNVNPGNSAGVNITFNASTLAPGNYTGTVTVTSNDPNHATTNLPVNLFVDLLIENDVGVTDISSPPDSMATGAAYPLIIEITNFGSQPHTFNAIFEVRRHGLPTIIYADTLTANNMPDSSVANYNFGSSFTPPEQGAYDLTTYTTLSGDQVPANNSFAKTVDSYDIVSIWYGNLNLTPVLGAIGGNMLVDVFLQTPASAFIGDMHLCLGADRQYIDTMISQINPILYYPLTDWAVAEFAAIQGSPPNPTGWYSQSFMGFASLGRLITDIPWLHSETPLKVMSFRLTTIYDESLIGQTHPAIGPGLHNLQGPSNVGDTIGGFGYQLTEQFSEITFREASGCDYLPGDVNSDGNVIGSDVTYLVNYFRSIGDPPHDSCWNDSDGAWLYAAADCNGDCRVIGSDVTYLVSYFRLIQTEILWCPQVPPMVAASIKDGASGNSDILNKK